MHTMMTQHETFRIFSLGTNIYFLEGQIHDKIELGVEKLEDKEADQQADLPSEKDRK